MPNLINQNNNMNESKINTKINEILKEFNAIEKSISKNSSNNFEQNKSIFEKYSELKKIADISNEYKKYINQKSDLELIINDPESKELKELAQEELEEIGLKVNQLRKQLIQKLFESDKDDKNNVIMEIRAGTGGEEASLFAQNLYRMYTRFAQRNKWETNILNSNLTGLGGIKEIIFDILSFVALTKSIIGLPKYFASIFFLFKLLAVILSLIIKVLHLGDFIKNISHGSHSEPFNL